MALGRRFIVMTLVWMSVLLLSHKSEGLSYEELVNGRDPVIPQAVRDSGNVSVSQSLTQSVDGVVSFVFKGLPNHGTVKTNPNDPEQQNFEVHLPENPTLNAQETCLTGGPIGWTIHGVALYNPFNVLGSNAVEGDEAEVFDSCQGHPDPNGIYHYHQLPDACVFPGVDTSVHGIARDGFPIYGPYKEDGTRVQEYELDKCHGRCGDDGRYRYHMTKTYPYIMGCYRGTPIEFTRSQDGTTIEQRPPRPPPPIRDGNGSPNKCAYNLAKGPNYEFQRCSADVQPNEDPQGNPTEPHRPGPRPRPGPGPRFEPRPGTGPRPRPGPGPGPGLGPRHELRPGPRSRPGPGPRFEPRPGPGPRPRPGPGPKHEPRPGPGSRPGPGLRPGPGSRPGPRPRPYSFRPRSHLQG